MSFVFIIINYSLKGMPMQPHTDRGNKHLTFQKKLHNKSLKISNYNSAILVISYITYKLEQEQVYSSLNRIYRERFCFYSGTWEDCSHKPQVFLTMENIKIEETRNIFRWRTRMARFGENYKGGREFVGNILTTRIWAWIVKLWEVKWTSSARWRISMQKQSQKKQPKCYFRWWSWGKHCLRMIEPEAEISRNHNNRKTASEAHVHGDRPPSCDSCFVCCCKDLLAACDNYRYNYLLCSL